MKYLSKEELEDIATKLLENPTRETLKALSDKYNNEEGKNIVNPVFSIPKDIPSTDMPKEELSKSAPEPTIPIFDAPMPPTNNINDSIPTLEIPQNNTPLQNNSTQVNFSGNLWEPQMPSIGSMMETTDNFNTTQNTIPNINPNNQDVPFFGPTSQAVNNPIPVSGPQNNGPSMFGQIQQNYTSGA